MTPSMVYSRTLPPSTPAEGRVWRHIKEKPKFNGLRPPTGREGEPPKGAPNVLHVSNIPGP